MAFAFSGYAFAAGVPRIVPKGKVSVYRAKKKVDELSAEAPLPYDALLLCSGECGFHIDSLYIVASDQSTFHVKAPPQDQLIAFVKGFFYFSLTDLSKKWVFKTPTEDFTVQQVLFQTAASGGRLDGYIHVKAESTEIGVLEGGSLVLSSSLGEHMVQSGNQITMAKVGGQPEMVTKSGTGEDGVDTRKIVLYGLIGAGVIAGAAALGSGGGSDSPPPASPSSP